MLNKPKSSGDKPRSKGKVGRRKQRKSRIPKASDWSFAPKLKNEAIVLHSILGKYEISYYEQIVLDIRNLITSLVRNHGFTDGSKRYNVIKQYTVDLIEFRDPENPGWLSTSEKYRVPSKLCENFIHLIIDYFLVTEPSERAKYYQAIITILNISRIVDGLSDADFKSVTEKAKPIKDEIMHGFSTYVAEKCSSYRYDIQEVNLSKFKVNFKKAGPNGQPKLESAIAEAVALRDSKQLWKPFNHLCDCLGVHYLFLYVDTLATQNVESIPIDTDTKLRKLVTVPDSGFKTRIVAIVDFWTQLALEPFRAHVQMVTRKLFGNTDFRLDQNQGVNAMVQFQKRCMVKEVVGKELDIQSLKFYDISSWTDRFHRDLQKVVIRELFGSKSAQAWAQLTVHCAWDVMDTGRTVKYGQGQGMGTNGSFDTATLTDHLFINYIYERVYEDYYFKEIDSYGKVGDDLWIYDPEDLLPKFYDEINLPINLSKSKSFCKLGSIAEFCSRTFYDGMDVSRISPKLISKSSNFRYIPLLLSYLASRGVQLSSSSFPYLNNSVKEGDESYFDKLQPWIISTFVGKSSSFEHLSLDYLKTGNWISDSTLSVISDQALLAKIGAAQCVTALSSFYEDIKLKTAEVQDAEGSLSMEDIYLLSLGKHDTYNLSSPVGAFASKWFETSGILSPKQIFVLDRYITQTQLVSDKFFQIYELDPMDPNYLGDLTDLLSEISQRSCYDRGNINYDTAAYISNQYEIVKTLDRFTEDFKTFSIEQSDLDGVSQLIGYPVQELESVWESIELKLIVPPDSI